MYTREKYRQIPDGVVDTQRLRLFDYTSEVLTLQDAQYLQVPTEFLSTEYLQVLEIPEHLGAIPSPYALGQGARSLEDYPKVSGVWIQSDKFVFEKPFTGRLQLLRKTALDRPVQEPTELLSAASLDKNFQQCLHITQELLGDAAAVYTPRVWTPPAKPPLIIPIVRLGIPVLQVPVSQERADEIRANLQGNPPNGYVQTLPEVRQLYTREKEHWITLLDSFQQKHPDAILVDRTGFQHAMFMNIKSYADMKFPVTATRTISEHAYGDTYNLVPPADGGSVPYCISRAVLEEYKYSPETASSTFIDVSEVPAYLKDTSNVAAWFSYDSGTRYQYVLGCVYKGEVYLYFSNIPLHAAFDYGFERKANEDILRVQDTLYWRPARSRSIYVYNTPTGAKSKSYIYTRGIPHTVYMYRLQHWPNTQTHEVSLYSVTVQARQDLVQTVVQPSEDMVIEDESYPVRPEFALSIIKESPGSPYRGFYQGFDDAYNVHLSRKAGKSTWYLGVPTGLSILDGSLRAPESGDVPTPAYQQLTQAVLVSKISFDTSKSYEPVRAYIEQLTNKYSGIIALSSLGLPAEFPEPYPTTIYEGMDWVYSRYSSVQLPMPATFSTHHIQLSKTVHYLDSNGMHDMLKRLDFNIEPVHLSGGLPYLSLITQAGYSIGVRHRLTLQEVVEAGVPVDTVYEVQGVVQANDYVAQVQRLYKPIPEGDVLQNMHRLMQACFAAMQHYNTLSRASSNNPNKFVIPVGVLWQQVQKD